MTARILSASPWGVEALPVEVEVDLGLGLPQTVLVGLPDAAVRESRERVRAAIRNLGFRLPQRSVVINLAPADLRKEGNHLDLAIALALLAAHGQLPEDALDGRLACGELALDGGLRPVRGALAIAEMAERHRVREMLIAADNAVEAAALDGPRVIAVRDLGEAVRHLTGVHTLTAASADTQAARHEPRPGPEPLDLADVRGQETARRALELAAAGGHNLLMVGPPGTGKTMLARRLPGILPPLERSETIAISRIHSLAGVGEGSLVTRRPFRAPHSTSSAAALVGGGSIPQPGEVTLAHGGVLFLDELAEFRRDALEALRQPLEDGLVTVSRCRARITFPARFALVAATNPCPCGHLGNPRRDCCCGPGALARYRQRISGPLLDRIDLHVEVPSPDLHELRGGPGEDSLTVAARVAQAREEQRRRFPSSHPLPCNASLRGDAVRNACRLCSEGERLLERAWSRLDLSPRSLERTLRLARTIADLAAEPRVRPPQLAEALEYRALERESRDLGSEPGLSGA